MCSPNASDPAESRRIFHVVVRTLPLVFLQDGPYVVGQGACYGPCDSRAEAEQVLADLLVAPSSTAGANQGGG